MPDACGAVGDGVGAPPDAAPTATDPVAATTDPVGATTTAAVPVEASDPDVPGGVGSTMPPQPPATKTIEAAASGSECKHPMGGH